MKWDEMTAEQRDRLVAEKVMKLATICTGKLAASHVNVPSRATSTAFSYWGIACDTCGFVGSCASESDIPKEHPPKVGIPRYSTDMNAAWQIVEKLGEELFDIRLYREEGLAKYRVNMWAQDGGMGAGYSDTSMPEAVCEAALRAMEVKIDG